MESLVPVGRCNAVTSWQNQPSTLAENCRKGRGVIRWTAQPSQDFSKAQRSCGTSTGMTESAAHRETVRPGFNVAFLPRARVCSTFHCSVESRGTQTSTLVLAWFLFLLGVALVACGRIPPLDDAAIRVPTNPDAAPDALIACNQVALSVAKHVLADVLLVLDRSGSMNDSINQNCSCDPSSNPKVVCDDLSNCRTRWSTLGAALDTTLSSTPFLHWGLKVFSSPDADSCAVTGGVEVPVGADTTADIQAQIAAITPSGETPTAAAIFAATAYLESQADANSKVILLATDGGPNCGGTPPSVYNDDVDGTTLAIAKARTEGFLVYVIGIGNVGNLDAFAQAGGSASYYPGQSSEEITQALASISKSATCAFTLPSMPFDPTGVAIYLDKTIIPKDASEGWTFGANAQTVLLHGSFCDQTLSDPASIVQVLFLGCGQAFPSTLP